MSTAFDNLRLQTRRLRQQYLEPIVASDSAITQWGVLLASGALIGYGFIRGSLFGLVTSATGAGLLYMALQNRHQRMIGDQSDLSQPIEPGPSIQDSAVDEASWESFPASDAPAY